MRLVVALVALAGLACSEGGRAGSDEPLFGSPVHVSPSGIPMRPRDPTPDEAERIRVADETLGQDPENVDLIVEAALAREVVWRYNDAIELYTRGMEISPDDYRLYLGRAHRLIRLRMFDKALVDLDRSVELDPYGFNSAYLRGLTLYLLGRFDDAANEYARCMALAQDGGALELAESGEVPGDPRHCMVIAVDSRSLVAMTAWRYRALMRAGRLDEAERLVAGIPKELSLSEEGMASYRTSTILPGTNEHYHKLIMFYRGLQSESELLDKGRWGEQWPTVAYGVGVWHLAQGNREKAVELLGEVVAQDFWARFGHVAAEADLVRLGARQVGG